MHIYTRCVPVILCATLHLSARLNAGSASTTACAKSMAKTLPVTTFLTKLFGRKSPWMMWNFLRRVVNTSMACLHSSSVQSAKSRSMAMPRSMTKPPIVPLGESIFELCSLGTTTPWQLFIFLYSRYSFAKAERCASSAKLNSFTAF